MNQESSIQQPAPVDKKGRFWATLLVSMLCVQIVAIEGGGISFVKVAIRGLSGGRLF